MRFLPMTNSLVGSEERRSYKGEDERGEENFVLMTLPQHGSPLL